MPLSLKDAALAFREAALASLPPCPLSAKDSCGPVTHSVAEGYGVTLYCRACVATHEIKGAVELPWVQAECDLQRALTKQTGLASWLRDADE